MNMVLRNRVNDFNGLHNEVERFLNGCTTSPQVHSDQVPLRFGQDEDNVYVEVIAPGLQSDSFEVHLEDDVLSIKAKAPESKEDGIQWRQKCLCIEEIDQKIRVRQPVESDKITAQYEQGVLRITLPLAPSSKPQRITVN